MKHLFICVFLGFFPLAPISLAWAQQQPPQPYQTPKSEIPPIYTQKVRGNIYQLQGGMGANTGFIIAEKEVLAIDAKMTEDSARQMITEIRKVTSLPIRTVILTHSDGDHVNGLVGFPEGTTIIAQEKTRVHVEKAFQSTRERSYLPNLTFSDRLSLYLDGLPGGRGVELIYFGPAHTDGDAVVFFSEEKVAFIGDLIFLGRDMVIHRHKNGNSFGLGKVLKAILNLEAEIFVSGHGEPATKRDIRNLIQGIEEKQTAIQALVKEGRTLEEVKKIFNVEGPSEGRRWMSLVEVIYLEVSEKKY
jgi:cyclase